MGVPHGWGHPVVCWVYLGVGVRGGVDQPTAGAFICLFMLVAAQSQTFFNTANVVTGVQNFRDFGGTIVGIMKVIPKRTRDFFPVCVKILDMDFFKLNWIKFLVLIKLY